MSESSPKNFFLRIEKSAIITVIGIILLFSGAVIVTLIAPGYVDPTWTSPTSPYQVQMYEVSDPHLYISNSETYTSDLQFVYHLKKDYSLLAFQESETVRVLAPKELEAYVTKLGEKPLKLTPSYYFSEIPPGAFVDELRKKERAEQRMDSQ